jgi:hypothetical protein
MDIYSKAHLDTYIREPVVMQCLEIYCITLGIRCLFSIRLYYYEGGLGHLKDKIKGHQMIKYKKKKIQCGQKLYCKHHYNNVALMPVKTLL